MYSSTYIHFIICTAVYKTIFLNIVKLNKLGKVFKSLEFSMHIQFVMNNLLFFNIITICQLLIVGKVLITEYRAENNIIWTCSACGE